MTTKVLTLPNDQECADGHHMDTSWICQIDQRSCRPLVGDLGVVCEQGRSGMVNWQSCATVENVNPQHH